MCGSTMRTKATMRIPGARRGGEREAVAAAMANGGDGLRSEASREGGRNPEREGRDAGVEGGAWRCEGRSRATGGQPGKQEVAGRRRRASARRSASSWREVSGDWQRPVGWASAGPAGGAR